jgi:UDP-glucose 4-epimerase
VVPFDDGVGRMMADIEHWRDAPLWDPQSIARATQTWFQYLGREA